MDYNQYNQNVPPYPQPNFDFRETKPTYVEKGKILENKDLENSFVNAVLKTAVGKEAKYYFTYPDSIKWRDMVYEGRLELVGEDFIVIRDKTTKHLHVLLMLYLEYVVFEEE